MSLPEAVAAAMVVLALVAVFVLVIRAWMDRYDADRWTLRGGCSNPDCQTCNAWRRAREIGR